MDDGRQLSVQVGDCVYELEHVARNHVFADSSFRLDGVEQRACLGEFLHEVDAPVIFEAGVKLDDVRML